MVTLSLTPFRVAGVLDRAADLLESEGWDPETNWILAAIDRAANYVPGCGSPDASDTTVDAWDALVTHLDEQLVVPWERESGRTQADVVAALRAAAEAVMAP